MVLFRNGNESPLGVPKRDQTVPKLLRVSPLRHSFRVVSLGARYDSTAESSDNDSTLSSPSYVDDDEDKVCLPRTLEVFAKIQETNTN
ncbi:hypothetical protein M8J77_005387 [Diaphorina citri]|nr:hypothetical protein M8J77_005387 [Diaphorina citri]